MEARGPGRAPIEECHCVASWEGGKGWHGPAGSRVATMHLGRPHPLSKQTWEWGGGGCDFSFCIFCLSVTWWSGTLGGLGRRR